MAFREVDVIEIRWCCAGWLDGVGFAHDRRAGGCGPRDRAALRRGSAGQWGGCAAMRGSRRCPDELIGAVIAAVRPARRTVTAQRGTCWRAQEEGDLGLGEGAGCAS